MLGSKTVSLRQMQCKITAIFLAVATAAFLKPFRSFKRVAQVSSGDGFLTCVIRVVAAEYSNRRRSRSPHFEMRPDQSISPDR